MVDFSRAKPCIYLIYPVILHPETKTIKAMLYTTKMINANYRIKVSGVDNNGNHVHKLVGVSGAIALIGEDFLMKFVSRAESAMQDVCVCKLRRGLKVSLYVK